MNNNNFIFGNGEMWMGHYPHAPDKGPFQVRDVRVEIEIQEAQWRPAWFALQRANLSPYNLVGHTSTSIPGQRYTRPLLQRQSVKVTLMAEPDIFPSTPPDFLTRSIELKHYSQPDSLFQVKFWMADIIQIIHGNNNTVECHFKIQSAPKDWSNEPLSPENSLMKITLQQTSKIFEKEHIKPQLDTRDIVRRIIKIRREP